MLKIRTLTIIILMPAVILMIWLGGWYFTVFLIASLGIAAYEWVELFRAKAYRPHFGYVVPGVAAALLLRHAGGEIQIGVVAFVFLFINLIGAIINYERDVKTAPIDLMINLGGIVYLGGLGNYFLAVRELPAGHLWLIFLVLVTGIGDTGAYLIGQRWGKHKIEKKVSPNKSWEGYGAGITFAMLTGAFYYWVSGDWFHLSLLQAVLLAGMIYIASPVGDFAISMIKRWAGKKDSGSLLPGHGGFLDRVDSHLWSAPVGYYLLTIFFL